VIKLEPRRSFGRRKEHQLSLRGGEGQYASGEERRWCKL
jgi:hypothetical protein